MLLFLKPSSFMLCLQKLMPMVAESVQAGQRKGVCLCVCGE